MKESKILITALMAAVLTALPARSQTNLTLEQCREMAVANSKQLEQERTKVEMAGYDKKIAFANYLPNISATGAYMYNGKDIALVGDETSQKLRGAGTVVGQSVGNQMTTLMTSIMSNPMAVAEYMQSPMWQTVIGALSQSDLTGAINAIGADIDDALHPDMQNVFAGVVSLQQPVFMGGKIVAANRIARLAEELARAGYELEYQQTIVDVDQAYWQIVSLAHKKELTEAYADLLHKMEKDAEAAVEAGVSTESDLLQVKVKANEADMLKTKAENGLALSKMLLCKQTGLPLDTPVTLADEGLQSIPAPRMSDGKAMEDIWADRPEIKSLDLAAQIYDGKVRVARADMMPRVAVTANYLVTNPNLYNGFENKWGGMFNAGVMVNVPIFHGFEAANKTRKAKAEASLYRSKMEDAKDMVNLQVTRLRKQEGEAMEKLAMAESNLESARENLRHADIGYREGVITTNTALAANTAWLQASSDYIDAGIELRMNKVNLDKAEGNIRPDKH